MSQDFVLPPDVATWFLSSVKDTPLLYGTRDDKSSKYGLQQILARVVSAVAVNTLSGFSSMYHAAVGTWNLLELIVICLTEDASSEKVIAAYNAVKGQFAMLSKNLAFSANFLLGTFFFVIDPDSMIELNAGLDRAFKEGLDSAKRDRPVEGRVSSHVFFNHMNKLFGKSDNFVDKTVNFTARFVSLAVFPVFTFLSSLYNWAMSFTYYMEAVFDAAFDSGASKTAFQRTKEHLSLSMRDIIVLTVTPILVLVAGLYLFDPGCAAKLSGRVEEVLTMAPPHVPPVDAHAQEAAVYQVDVSSVSIAICV